MGLKLTSMPVRHLVDPLGLSMSIFDASWVHSYFNQCLIFYLFFPSHLTCPRPPPSHLLSYLSPSYTDLNSTHLKTCLTIPEIQPAANQKDNNIKVSVVRRQLANSSVIVFKLFSGFGQFQIVTVLKLVASYFLKYQMWCFWFVSQILYSYYLIL